MRVHFLGIGGSGASAAAHLALANGFEVSGCDKEPFNEFTRNFDQAILQTGHSKDHLENIDILAVTPAIYSLDPNNEELVTAQKNGVEVLTWQQFLGKYIAQDKQTIAICGTHGKSTTTAMVGNLLEDAGLDPTVFLGANYSKWGGNFRAGRGKYFVVEADEFNNNFLAFNPDYSIVTNIEMDHPEFFKNFEDYKTSFRNFLVKTKKIILANLANIGVKDVTNDITSSKVIDYSFKLIDFDLKIPGEFNIVNASAVYYLGELFEIDKEAIKKSLQNFSGIDRRFEFIGNYRGAFIYSDFGHHPTEIKVTLEAARAKFPNKKIVVIFQPHMFSRTYGLFDDFVKVFQNLPVDETLIIDIYPSREIDRGLVTSKKLVDEINKKSVKYVGSEEEAYNWALENINEGEVIFFLGAGNTDQLAKKLVRN